MTLNAKIGFLWILLAISGCETFQERIAPKSNEIDIKNLRMKFLTLNVDFKGSSLDILVLRKPAQEGIKKRYSRKSRYLTVVGQSLSLIHI